MGLSLRPIAVCKTHPKLAHYAVIQNMPGKIPDHEAKTRELETVVGVLSDSEIAAEICPR